MSKVIFSLFILLSSPIFAHENQKDIPCDASLTYNLLVYSFPTHTTINEDLLNLEDGKIYIGIEMNVEGENLNFTKSFNVAYTKEEENLKGSSNWSNQDLSPENLKKLGQFPKIKCKILGAVNN